MDGGEPGKDADFGFKKIAGETKRKIANHEKFKEVAFAMRVPGHGENKTAEQDDEENFVELGGMAAEAIAEVDPPRQRGDGASGLVINAGEEAANAPDGDAKAQRKGEEVPGPDGNAEQALGKFDSKESADQRADDGLAGKKKRRL